MSSSSSSLLRALPIVAFLPLLAACDDHAASATAKPDRPVQVERVAFENENATREFVGVVRARYETDLGFRVSGKIVERVVNVGDRVRAGDVIARLDPQDLRLQVESAEAELSAATSSLAQAASDLERYAGLKTKGYAPVADFERKRQPTTRPRAASCVPGAPWIFRAINSPMPISRRMSTASSPRRARSPDRSSPSVRRWRSSPTAAKRKPWSRCRKPGSAKCARRR